MKFLLKSPKASKFSGPALRYKEGESISTYTPVLNIIINLDVLVKLQCILLDLFSFFFKIKSCFTF